MTLSSGESRPTAKVTWKPERSLPLVTEIERRASITTRGAGTGTAGPISSVRWTPSSIRGSGDALRQGDADARADPGGELVGLQGGVGVGQAPELFRVAQDLGGDVVEALALRHHVEAQGGEQLRR